jgi:hypothetical protein
MFAYFNKEGLFGLRLPEKEREAFVKKYKTAPFMAYGIVIKEYVHVPDELLKNTKALKPYFEKSYAYVDSLKAK